MQDTAFLPSRILFFNARLSPFNQESPIAKARHVARMVHFLERANSNTLAISEGCLLASKEVGVQLSETIMTPFDDLIDTMLLIGRMLRFKSGGNEQ